MSLRSFVAAFSQKLSTSEREHLMKRLVIPALMILSFATFANAAIKITYPTPNSTVPGEVIEVKGTGADLNGQIQVEVLTNKWYIQDGTATVNPDGSWSYAPCHLSGQGNFNNHTIRVTIIKDGKPDGSDSVAGIRRK